MKTPKSKVPSTTTAPNSILAAGRKSYHNGRVASVACSRPGGNRTLSMNRGGDSTQKSSSSASSSSTIAVGPSASVRARCKVWPPPTATDLMLASMLDGREGGGKKADERTKKRRRPEELQMQQPSSVPGGRSGGAGGMGGRFDGGTSAPPPTTSASVTAWSGIVARASSASSSTRFAPSSSSARGLAHSSTRANPFLKAEEKPLLAASRGRANSGRGSARSKESRSGGNCRSSQPPPVEERKNVELSDRTLATSRLRSALCEPGESTAEENKGEARLLIGACVGKENSKNCPDYSAVAPLFEEPAKTAPQQVLSSTLGTGGARTALGGSSKRRRVGLGNIRGAGVLSGRKAGRSFVAPPCSGAVIKCKGDRMESSKVHPPKPVDVSNNGGCTIAMESKPKTLPPPPPPVLTVPIPPPPQADPSGHRTGPINANPTRSSTDPPFHTSSKKRTNKLPNSKSSAHQGNFVRLNLKNAAGACRGARKKSTKFKRRFGTLERTDIGGNGEGGGSDDDGSGFGWKRRGRRKHQGAPPPNAAARNAGVDPIDDYLDGVLTKPVAADSSYEVDGSAEGRKSSSDGRPLPSLGDELTTRVDEGAGAPRCSRHGRPCKLVTVKSNARGNRGRKFYVCSLPRGEGCDFFQWAEDSIESARRALLRSSTAEGFVARQVAAHAERFGQLTVPELQKEAKKRGLNDKGKKKELLARLKVWARDEIACGQPKISGGDEEGKKNDCKDTAESYADSAASGEREHTEEELEHNDEEESEHNVDYDDDEEESDCSSSDSELEICGAPTVVAASMVDHDGDSYSNNEQPQDGRDIDLNTSTPPLSALKALFGYDAFRDGQEWAIRRTLAKKRTLLVAPTGLGKSLCYALPAALMDGVCVVVSPLVSLMHDQLLHLPPRIPAATLSGSMTTTAMATVVDDIARGRIKILFVSPERLASAAFRRLLRPRRDPLTGNYERAFPTVSALCVDESHCLSQWGHNFRPSYLRIKSLIPLLRPESVLAITATAGPAVVRDICRTLGIPFGSRCGGDAIAVPPPALPIPGACDGDNEGNGLKKPDPFVVDPVGTDYGVGIKVLECNRDNIDVSAMILDSEEGRRTMLIKLLKDNDNRTNVDGQRMSDKLAGGSHLQPGCLASGSVIVYVWRQRDAEVVAEQLNGASIAGGVVFYHGGMDASSRAKAQGRFMRGKARVCVATVAFGLGLNKPDVSSVVHMCLPPSPENYLQEIGRAGRDGRAAMAVALLVSDDIVLKHSLAHSASICPSQVRAMLHLLQGLLDEALNDVASQGGPEAGALPGVDLALPVTATVNATDCKQETIETLLSLLEEGTGSDTPLMSVEGFLCDRVTITLKKRSMEKLASKELIAQSVERCARRLDKPLGGVKGTPREHDNALPWHREDQGGTASQKGFLAYSFGCYQFSAVRCARMMGPGASSRHVFAALRRLQSSGEIELALDMSDNGRAVHLYLNAAGIQHLRCKDLEPMDDPEQSLSPINNLARRLADHFANQVSTCVDKVETMRRILHRVAGVALQIDDDDDDHEGLDDEGESRAARGKSPRLILFQKMIQHYFAAANDGSNISEMETSEDSMSSLGRDDLSDVLKEILLDDDRNMAQLTADVASFLRDPTLSKPSSYPGAVHINGGVEHGDYRALCVSKLLHAIDSPRAKFADYSRHPLFGRWRHVRFGSVHKAVQHILASHKL